MIFGKWCKFHIPVHLIPEDVGEHEGLRLDVLGDFDHVCFVHLKDCNRFFLALVLGARKNVVTMPCSMLEPVGFVRTSSYFCCKTRTVKAVVSVLPLVPVTITTS